MLGERVRVKRSEWFVSVARMSCSFGEDFRSSREVFWGLKLKEGRVRRMICSGLEVGMSWEESWWVFWRERGRLKRAKSERVVMMMTWGFLKRIRKSFIFLNGEVLGLSDER